MSSRHCASRSITEISEEEGISQQAVSKSIRAVYKRIREGLIHDGVLEAR